MGWQMRPTRAFARRGVFDTGPRTVVDAVREILVAATLAFAAFGGLACSVEVTGGSTGDGAQVGEGHTAGTVELGAPRVAEFKLHGTRPRAGCSGNGEP